MKKDNNIIRTLKPYKLDTLLFVCTAAFLYGIALVFLLNNEAIGDDVSGVFVNATAYYLGESHVEYYRVESFEQFIDSIVFLYNNWGGRILGYFISGLGFVSPMWCRAIIGSFFQVGNCILIIRLACNSRSGIVKHSVALILIYCVMYWYRPLAYFNYMWTFLSFYEASLFAALLYIILSRTYEKHSVINEILLQILGFMVGISHEMFLGLTIVIVGLDWLKKVKNRQLRIKSIIHHLGLLMGTPICFLAPGNFSRYNSAHEDAIRAIPFYERLEASFMGHLNILFPQNMFVKIAFLLLIVWAFLCTFRLFKTHNSKDEIHRILNKTGIFIIAGVASIVSWGVMPKTQAYGLSFWIALVFVVLILMINNSSNMPLKIRCPLFEPLLVLFMIVLLVVNEYPRMEAFVQTSQERKALISQAVLEKKGEVIVPRYPEECKSERINFDYLNNQNFYDEPYVDAYYGIHVLIK